MHKIAADDITGIVADEKFSSITLDDGMKVETTVTLGGLRLEHEADAAVALRAEKRNPVRDMSLRAVVLRAGTMTNDTVKTTPVVFAK